MHAVIKIVSFLVFGAAMTTGSGPVLSAGAILVILLYLLEMSQVSSGETLNTLQHAFNMLKRLRWLFLSILIVYLFFTPGVLLWPDVLWSPTEEGLLQGLARIAVLVLIVAAVNVLIATTEQADFLSAVSWCLWPLSWLGVSHERLALRISLTLTAVGVLRKTYRHETRDEPVSENAVAESTGPKSFNPRLMTIAKTAHRLFAKVIDDAQHASLPEISLPEESRPPLVQWIIPVLLAVVLMGLHMISLDMR